MNNLKSGFYFNHLSEEVITEINAEIGRAKAKHGDYHFNSHHEGYAVLLEEVDELWYEVKHGKDPEKLKEEAVQVAAMAIRFIQELT